MKSNKIAVTIFGLGLAILAVGLEVYAVENINYKADTGFIWLGVVLCYLVVVFDD